MTAATFTIFWMQIQLEWHSIIFCSFGATFGMILGLEVVDSLLDPPTKKLGFVCIWFSFAFALYLLNRYIKKTCLVAAHNSSKKNMRAICWCLLKYLSFRQHKRKTFDSIPQFGYWHAVTLFVTGFVGGIFSAIAGSGVDICSFSVLSLLFRYNS